MGHVAVMSMYILMEGNRLLKVNSSLVAVTESIPFMPEPDREQPQQLGRSSNSEGFHVVRVFMFDLSERRRLPGQPVCVGFQAICSSRRGIRGSYGPYPLPRPLQVRHRVERLLQAAQRGLGSAVT